MNPLMAAVLGTSAAYVQAVHPWWQEAVWMLEAAGVTVLGFLLGLRSGGRAFARKNIAILAVYLAATGVCILMLWFRPSVGVYSLVAQPPIGLGLLIWFWSRGRHEAARRFWNTCGQCGRDLTGDTSGVCLECGERV